MTGPDLTALTSVTLDRVYATDVDDLWDAVTDPARLARWYAPVSGTLAVGGEVVVAFDDGDATYVVDGCRPPSELRLRWRHDTGDSLVVVRLTPVDGGARLALEHSGLTARQAPGYAAGWHWYLDELVVHLGGDVPDRASWDELFARYTA